MSLRWTLFHGIHLSGEVIVSVTRVYADVSVGGAGGRGGGESYQYARVFLECGGKYSPLPSALENLENKLCNIIIYYSFD